jgi:hypothetical protein
MLRGGPRVCARRGSHQRRSDFEGFSALGRPQRTRLVYRMLRTILGCPGPARALGPFPRRSPETPASRLLADRCGWENSRSHEKTSARTAKGAWAKLRCGSTCCANRRYSTMASDSGPLAVGSSATCWSGSFPAILSSTWRRIRTGRRHCLDTRAPPACATYGPGGAAWEDPGSGPRLAATAGDIFAPGPRSKARWALIVPVLSPVLAGCGAFTHHTSRPEKPNRIRLEQHRDF